MKKLLLAALLIAVVAAAYVTGYAHGQRETNITVLGHALESVSLCANGLLHETKTSRLLDARLRSAVETAEWLTRDGVNIDVPIPNLLDGLRRAKLYADRVGDAELSKRVAALQERIARGVK